MELIRSGLLQVREDLRDHLRLLDAGNDLRLPAAAGAVLDLDAEQHLQYWDLDALTKGHRAA
jgi:hypothetical protein